MKVAISYNSHVMTENVLWGHGTGVTDTLFRGIGSAGGAKWMIVASIERW